MNWTRGVPILWIATFALLGAITGLSISWDATFPATLWISTLLFAVLGIILVIDAKTRYIPDPWTIIGGSLVLLHPIAIAVSSDVFAGLFILLLTLVGASIAFCLFAITRILSKNQLGLGDVKLAPVLGGWLLPIGWTALGLGFVFTAIIGAIWVILTTYVAKKPGAYGPAMILGTVLATALT